MTENNNRKAIDRLRSQLSDHLLPQPDLWDSEQVMDAWHRYQQLRDQAEEYIDEAYHADSAIGRATSAYEARYRAFLNGKLEDEPEEPDYASLRDATTSAVARAGAAVSRALSARSAYQRLLKSEENQQFRFEKARQAMMPAREKAQKAWQQFRSMWGQYTSARAVVRRQVFDRGLHERGGVQADDLSDAAMSDLKGFSDAVSRLDRIVLSNDFRLTLSWASAPIEELERELPDWTRQFIAQWGTPNETQMLWRAEMYERANGVVKSAYLVPADLPPEEAAKRAPSERPFGAEVD